MKKPSKPKQKYKPFRAVRIPKDDADACDKIARRNGRTLANQVVTIVREFNAANS